MQLDSRRPSGAAPERVGRPSSPGRRATVRGERHAPAVGTGSPSAPRSRFARCAVARLGSDARSAGRTPAAARTCAHYTELDGEPATRPPAGDDVPPFDPVGGRPRLSAGASPSPGQDRAAPAPSAGPRSLLARAPRPIAASTVLTLTIWREVERLFGSSDGSVRTGADVAGVLDERADAVRTLTTGRLRAGARRARPAPLPSSGCDVAVVWLPRRERRRRGERVEQLRQPRGRARGARRPDRRVSDGTWAARGRARAARRAPAMVHTGVSVGALQVSTAAGSRRRSARPGSVALAAEPAGPATRPSSGALGPGADEGALDVAGDALDAVAEERGTPGKPGAAGRGVRTPRRRAPAAPALGLEAEGTYGPVAAHAVSRAVAASLLDGSDTLSVRRDGGWIGLSVQLGQPALGALQLRFRPGASPARCARAAGQLRRPRRACPARRGSVLGNPGWSLERSRALLSVVSEAISRLLALAHARDRWSNGSAELLDADRVAVYLREDESIVVAACEGLDGPHGQVAAALLDVSRSPAAQAARSWRSPMPPLTSGCGACASWRSPRSSRRSPSCARGQPGSDRPAGRVSAPPEPVHRERARPPRGARSPARRRGRERAPARTRDSARAEARWWRPVRAEQLEAAASARRDLVLASGTEPVARHDARGCWRVDRRRARGQTRP